MPGLVTSDTEKKVVSTSEPANSNQPDAPLSNSTATTASTATIGTSQSTVKFLVASRPSPGEKRKRVEKESTEEDTDSTDEERSEFTRPPKKQLPTKKSSNSSTQDQNQLGVASEIPTDEGDANVRLTSQKPPQSTSNHNFISKQKSNNSITSLSKAASNHGLFDTDKSGSGEDSSSKEENGGKADTRPVCKYGSKCYRKNPDHFKEFAHPHLDK